MKEAKLKRFFNNEISPDDWITDLRGAITVKGMIARHHIEDMDLEFEVKPDHLVKVCDLFLEGKLSGSDLRAVGFCLQASDNFVWSADTEEGGRVCDVVFYMACPEINYEFTVENVEKFKELLVKGGDPFAAST